MTRKLMPARRVAALSVVVTLLAAPIASAQSQEGVPSGAPSANTALLSPAAFARLIQPPPADVVPAPVVAEPPRLSLLRQATAAIVGQAAITPTQASGTVHRSWMARHKWAFIVPGIIFGAIVGGYGLWVATGCGSNDC